MCSCKLWMKQIDSFNRWIQMNSYLKICLFKEMIFSCYFSVFNLFFMLFSTIQFDHLSISSICHLKCLIIFILIHLILLFMHLQMQCLLQILYLILHSQKVNSRLFLFHSLLHCSAIMEKISVFCLLTAFNLNSWSDEQLSQQQRNRRITNEIH